VLAKDLRVLGYYSLAAGSVTHDEATERVKKGEARLAVDMSIHGQGLL
jgi:hypothetical protein